jgi:hypothetical protein
VYVDCVFPSITFISFLDLDSMQNTVLMALPNLAPLHLFLYSTLLGTELYQTFVVTKVCYNALPRSAFTTLQKQIFPKYFQGQAFLLLSTAFTFPPYSLASLLQSKWELIPFLIAGSTAGLNLLFYEPKTRQSMIERIHQGRS